MTGNVVIHSPARDPAGLRGFLAARFARERAQAARELLVHLLAVMSLAVWLLALDPALLDRPMRLLVLGAWGVAFLLAAGSAAAEWRLQRLERRRLVRLDTR